MSLRRAGSTHCRYPQGPGQLVILDLESVFVLELFGQVLHDVDPKRKCSEPGTRLLCGVEVVLVGLVAGQAFHKEGLFCGFALVVQSSCSLANLRALGFDRKFGLVDKIIDKENVSRCQCLKEAVSSLSWVSNPESSHLDNVAQESMKVVGGGDGGGPAK